MKIPKPKVTMPRITPDRVEAAGFVCLIVAAVCAGLLFSGALAAATLGFLVAGLVLVLAGNVDGGA